ncbi:MAG: hypothetical protein A2513_03280 [Sulfurimonas sp. RIFOXYD12_FULL_33_39]|uniref:glycosyltransferase family 4 protein n=1 Tax=unclassified Sulfurimonas TaxID=2623549 RepID=UPI0008C09149|nr:MULTISPECIES: glycosyltransferase family 1 protein [unclassified Sulfurimonas]OHE09013.1 MAG: hypothetical protein A2513_03280 [Sulfurimonas sp. RIFOXYD12_FULL_33_39]OHE14323.1 MAG: hypothetical protein A2530_06580 [Sulfurimonas sp. RIFOXYD2_FULL_34_21]
MKFLIVYDNIIFSLQKIGGISIYWAELIKKLQLKKSKIVFYQSKNENIAISELDIETTLESKLSFKILRYLPFLKKIPSKSLFHSSYYRVSLQKDIVNITTVYDFTYEYFRKGLAKYVHVKQKAFAIKKSDAIICMSENTKKDLMKFYPQIQKSKIKVIYNGVGCEFKKLQNKEEYLNAEFEILKDKNYILYIGDRRSSYKNFNIAVEVLKELKEYSFVVAGAQKFNKQENEIMESIKERVHYFDKIDAKKLNILYNNAFCLLYPSSYEGFGIPVVEAMKSGCPVVGTNISSIPEVAGNSGLLVDDIKTESFIKEIEKLKNSTFRDELISKGFKQAEKFNWDNCFSQTYEFYEEIWRKKFGE